MTDYGSLFCGDISATSNDCLPELKREATTEAECSLQQPGALCENKSYNCNSFRESEMESRKHPRIVSDAPDQKSLSTERKYYI